MASVGSPRERAEVAGAQAVANLPGDDAVGDPAPGPVTMTPHIRSLTLGCWAHHRQVDLGMWTIDPATARDPVPRPEPGAPPGTPWPANNNAPWTITRTPRTRWRL